MKKFGEREKNYIIVPLSEDDDGSFLERRHKECDEYVYIKPLRKRNIRNYLLSTQALCTSYWNLAFFLGFNFCFAFTNLYWYNNTQAWLTNMKHWCPDIPASPLITGFYYKRTSLDDSADTWDNPFFGDYRPEMEDAWWEIKKKAFFRASKEEMIQWDEYGEDSVELASGGYEAHLRVYHELHCIEWLKMEYSNPNITIDPIYEPWHLDHCVGMILNSVLCRGDMTTYSLHRGPNERQLHRTQLSNEHVCVNWDNVEAWLKPRELQAVGKIQEPAIGLNGELVSQQDVLDLAVPH